MGFISTTVDSGRTKLEKLPEARQDGKLEIYSSQGLSVLAQPLSGEGALWPISGAFLREAGSLVITIGAAEYWVEVAVTTNICYRWVEAKR